MLNFFVKSASNNAQIMLFVLFYANWTDIIWNLGPSNLSLFHISVYSECKTSTHIKSYCYLKFVCCIIARQYEKMRLGNIHKICLVSGESEQKYWIKNQCRNLWKIVKSKENLVVFLFTLRKIDTVLSNCQKFFQYQNNLRALS